LDFRFHLPHRAFRNCVLRLRQTAPLIPENRLFILPAGRDFQISSAPQIKGFGFRGQASGTYLSVGRRRLKNDL
jgi:hypothetical protein